MTARKIARYTAGKKPRNDARKKATNTPSKMTIETA